MGMVLPNFIPPISYSELMCGWCHKPFTAATHVHEIAPHRYCSAECYDANHRELIEEWNRKLLQASAKPAPLYTPEPTYSPLVEDFMLAVGTLLLVVWRRFVSFLNREDDDLDSIRASSSERDDFMEYLSAKYFEKPDSHTPLVFPGTVIYTDESLLRLPVQRGGDIEPPPDVHVAIHQIGTTEPIGWFDDKGNWLEVPSQADHSEMQFAPSDWRRE